MIIISACLAGVNCKYNGGNNLNKDIIEIMKEGKGVLVCPEQLGGLTTPRVPCEIVDNKNLKVINKFNEDKTLEFIKGAEETLRIAKTVNAKIAILKSKSPSCGCGLIYDGTFSGKIINGNGITTDCLIKNGIKVYNENNIPIDILK